jgi:sortase family protein
VPRRPPPVTGARMPESVLRKQPAQVITAPPPGTITGPLPPPPAMPGRHPFRAPHPRVQPKSPPRPTRGKRPWPIGLIVLALVFFGLFLVAMGIGAATNINLPDWFGSRSDEPPPRAFPVLDPSRPERLTIPSIKVEAPILDVGLATDGSVAVPPLKRHNEAGWFDGGPTPGQFGPALIVGHADTKSGPSVFYDLPKLKPGQRVEVLRADHSVAVFEINSVEHFDKGKLPVQRVYGDYSRPSLRLMTCGGQWVGGKTGYQDNIVVFASLVDTRKA